MPRGTISQHLGLLGRHSLPMATRIVDRPLPFVTPPRAEHPNPLRSLPKSRLVETPSVASGGRALDASPEIAGLAIFCVV